MQDCHAGADPEYRMPVRIITELAWHSHFARNMFLTPKTNEEYRRFMPDFTVICAPSFKGISQIDGTATETFIVLNFAQRLCIIGNTAYAGEIKKSIFTILNYLLPLENVMPMHCSANMSHDGETAIFFGLSGTGKTTLSADPQRRLIGDDEHGWSDQGVFNFEGGCYAKVIQLSPTAEPQIYATTRMFGTILENVVYDPVTRLIDLDADTITENTRASYPLEFIANAVPEKRGGHPKNIILLTRKILKYGAHCWLVNTGWIGGPYGIGKENYRQKYRELAARFIENFKKLEADCPPEVRNAGPKRQN